ADGVAALAAIRRTEGRAENPDDAEVIEGIRLLAETEGLFAETAGGVVVASARRLAHAGAFADGEPVVLQISGQGMKTVEAFGGAAPFAHVIDARIADFEAFWSQRGTAA